MITPVTSVRRLARPAGTAAVVLALAGGLAAGCGSATGSAAASGGAASSGASGGASASPAPSPSASAVPTVSGGTVPAGEVACAGWPSSAPSGSLPTTFVPVSVERCVSGAQNVAGQLWTTATLERADSGLAGLIIALRQAPGRHRPGTMCPALATIPPQIVLFSATGQELMPRLPVTGCGITQSQVLLSLAALHWHPVSVRLLAPIAGTPASSAPASGETVSGSPRGLQTLSAAG